MGYTPRTTEGGTQMKESEVRHIGVVGGGVMGGGGRMGMGIGISSCVFRTTDSRAI